MAKSVVKKQTARPKSKKTKKQPLKPRAVKPEWATKEDIAQLATKKSIGRLATKEEIAKLATKDEMALLASKLATKEEVSKLASKEEWNRLERRIADLEKKLDTADKKIELLVTQLGSDPEKLTRINSELMQIRDVMAGLEIKSGEMRNFENSLFQHENRLNELETKIRNMEGTA
jgi:uncharacterized coiled-coil protein SlyX